MGSFKMDSAPSAITTIASTQAKIGRSIKKRDIESVTSLKKFDLEEDAQQAYRNTMKNKLTIYILCTIKPAVYTHYLSYPPLNFPIIFLAHISLID